MINHNSPLIWGNSTGNRAISAIDVCWIFKKEILAAETKELDTTQQKSMVKTWFGSHKSLRMDTKRKDVVICQGTNGETAETLLQPCRNENAAAC